MGEILRLLVAVPVCFVAGYFAINWYRAGGPLPIPVATVRPLQPSKSLPTFAESVEQSRKKEALESQTLQQDDNDPERDALRRATLQAANGYVQSPCDATMKANLIKALSAYAGALAEKAGCTSWGCTNEARVDLAFAMFGTPLDKRVREAVQEAFEQGGITLAEFPAKMKMPLITMTRSAGDPVSACSPERASRDSGPRTRSTSVSDTPRSQPASDSPRTSSFSGTTATGPEPWSKNEPIMINGRKSARKSILDALYLPNGTMCSPDGHKQMIDAISYYYELRHIQERGYASSWGKAGGTYIKEAWDTADDQRVVQKTLEIFSRGYFKVAEFKGAARERLSTMLAKEKVPEFACTTL